jgi:hypothetical protein
MRGGPAIMPGRIRKPQELFMETNIRSKLATAAQALAFVQAHPDTDPGYVAVVARLQAAVAQGDALAIQQRDGTANEEAAHSQRQDSRDEMQVQLRHLARVGRDALAAHPELQGAFLLPHSTVTNETFITAAKSMLATMTAQQDMLVGMGLGSTFVADFTAAVATFDAATAEASANRASHAGARNDLTAVARECVHVVRLLNGLNRVRFRDDPELAGEWASVSRLPKGSKRKKKVAPVPVPVPATAPVQESVTVPVTKDPSLK